MLPNIISVQDGTMIKTEAVWTSEPAQWSFDPRGVLRATARPRTDFWRKTRNGFIMDNGHMYGTQVHGDFVMRAKISGQFKEPYDQAGLMVLLDRTIWVKAGIELLGETCHLTSVVTRSYSDWAVCRPLPSPLLWLTVERDRDAIMVSASLDGESYVQARECTLTGELTLEVGPYLAAPAGSGFSAQFEDFEIQQRRQPARIRPAE